VGKKIITMQEHYLPVPVRSIEIEQLKKQHPELIITDSYRDQLEELFLLRNPRFKFDKNYQEPLAAFLKEQNPDGTADGNWFYFPWSNTLAHYLPEPVHFEMRTGRNKNLITADEQDRYYNSVVGIAGLSVGSHAALTIAMTGGAKTMKLADLDTLSGPNLNRVRAGIPQVGTNKAVLVARAILEINPYAHVSVYADGVNPDNIDSFLSQPKLNVLIEEMDNPYFKFKIREEARSRGIATIMATDNGDGIIADVERFDLDQNYPLFHGLAEGLSAEGLKTMKPTDLPKIATAIAGGPLVVKRMMESLAEVGKTLYSWPQLGTAANLCGSALAYLTRQIIVNKDGVKSGRYQVSLENIFKK
jgi:hypothetical protein